MKRKFISLLLAICTLSTLVACGNDNTDKQTNNVETNIENDVEANVENNSQNNEEDAKNNANYNSMLLDKYPNQKICEKDWTELTFILDDKEYTLGNKLSDYDFEAMGYIPTLSITDISDSETLKETTVKKQEELHYYKSGMNILEPITLNLVNPTSEEISIYDCVVNGINIGASLYSLDMADDFPTFSINGLKFGDTKETMLEKLGTNYVSEKESKKGITIYKYMNENETKGLVIQLNSRGIMSFNLAYKVEPVEPIEPEEINEEIAIDLNNPIIMPSENWTDMELVINGSLVNLEDLTYPQLTTLIEGRVSENYEDNTIKTNKISMMDIWLYEGSKDSLNVKFYNKSQEEILLTDCYISSIQQTLEIKEESKDEVIFCKGLMPGQEITEDQIKEMFGEPTETSKNTLIYKDDTNKAFEITIKENKITSLKLWYK